MREKSKNYLTKQDSEGNGGNPIQHKLDSKFSEERFDPVRGAAQTKIIVEVQPSTPPISLIHCIHINN